MSSTAAAAGARQEGVRTAGQAEGNRSQPECFPRRGRLKGAGRTESGLAQPGELTAVRRPAEHRPRETRRLRVPGEDHRAVMDEQRRDLTTVSHDPHVDDPASAEPAAVQRPSPKMWTARGVGTNPGDESVSDGRYSDGTGLGPARTADLSRRQLPARPERPRQPSTRAPNPPTALPPSAARMKSATLATPVPKPPPSSAPAKLIRANRGEARAHHGSPPRSCALT